jgi:hypothetical protein
MIPPIPSTCAARTSHAWVALVLVLLAVSLRAESAPAPVITQGQYRAQLQALLAATRQIDEPGRLAGAVAALPAAWHVDAGQHQFVVPTEWLRADLLALQRKPDPEIRARTQVQLQRLLADLDGYDLAPRDTSKDRRALTAILARREFAAVHGPTWFDRLKRQIAELLVRLVERIFGSSSFPVIASIIVYVLIGLALLVTALWVYRTLAGGQSQPVVPEHVPISAKQWTVWLAEAREAAAGGRWRDAVRLAYWAGISCLESRGVWPPDRARTPREYLRLLPDASEHRPALSALTRTFEPVWYGDRAADAATFARTVSDLERLGAVSFVGARHAVPPQDLPAGDVGARRAVPRHDLPVDQEKPRWPSS